MSDDVSKIQQVLIRYCHRLDRGSAEEVAQLFAEDGVMRPAYESSEAVRGRETIRRWYERYISQSRAGLRNLKHKPTAMQVDVDGDRGSIVAYFTAMFVKDGVFVQIFGTYHDQMVRVGGVWLFAEHRIETDLALPGAPIASS